MIVLVTLTVGLVAWVVAWTFGMKALDAATIIAIFVFGAVAVHLAMPAIRQVIHGKPASPGEQ
ncbi:MAG: hypothetical protein GXY03_09315 [Solirubrobacterales bacterium]|nr:hypothetical protein [Solirubrobacterales bacterium]